jgi:hypothetical protein
VFGCWLHKEFFICEILTHNILGMFELRIAQVEQSTMAASATTPQGARQHNTHNTTKQNNTTQPNTYNTPLSS